MHKNLPKNAGDAVKVKKKWQLLLRCTHTRGDPSARGWNIKVFLQINQKF